MHYAVCSIVCAVSLCLCPTLSQYLFSLITMGACCGCLDGFFGRLLFRSAAFVFRHWLSRVLFVCLCVCVGMCAKSVRAHVHICPHASTLTKTEVGRNRTAAHASLSSHMVMYPSSFRVFLLSGLITAVFRESCGFLDGLSKLHVHTHTAH